MFFIIIWEILMNSTIDELVDMFNIVKEEWKQYMGVEAKESMERISETIDEINRTQRNIAEKAFNFA